MLANFQLKFPYFEAISTNRVITRERTEEYRGKMEVGGANLKRASREALNATKVIALDEFKRLVTSGHISRASSMSNDEKIQHFGSTVVPIFVPLAPGETEQQYEERFRSFLMRRRGMTLGELVASTKSRTTERHYRMKFAGANALGVERFQPETRPPQVGSEECRGGADPAACQACQCRQCLTRSMQLLAQRITVLETNARLALLRSKEFCNLLVQNLWQDYHEINELIIMNENVLAASMTTLAGESIANIGATTRLLDENYELEEMVHEEHGRRNVALAMVALFLWRFNPEELQRMINDETASDVPFIQRTSHHEIAKIMAELKSKTSAFSRRPKPQKIDLLDQEIDQLKCSRKKLVAVLVHFDKQLRKLLGSLLAQADVL